MNFKKITIKSADYEVTPEKGCRVWRYYIDTECGHLIVFKIENIYKTEWPEYNREEALSIIFVDKMKKLLETLRDFYTYDNRVFCKKCANKRKNKNRLKLVKRDKI